MKFAKFMSSLTGRLLRIVAGIIVILVGLLVVQGTGGVILAAVGALLVLVGGLNVCLFAPLFGGPFKGSDVK